MTRYLGIDYGTRRIGLAISDGLGLNARPLTVVRPSEAVNRVVELVEEHDVSVLVIGLPTTLAGEEGASAAGAKALATELAEATGLEVEFVDEKYTSKMAEEKLIDAGMRRRKRRDTVDKVAAAIILQDFLDNRARRGNP